MGWRSKTHGAAISAVLGLGLVSAAPSPSVAQLPAVMSLKDPGPIISLTPGAVERGVSFRRQAVFAVEGRAGQRVKLSLETDAPRDVTVRVSHLPYRVLGVQPLMTATGKTIDAAVTLPAEGLYYFMVSARALAPDFTYVASVTLDGVAPRQTRAAALGGPRKSLAETPPPAPAMERQRAPAVASAVLRPGPVAVSKPEALTPVVSDGTLTRAQVAARCLPNGCWGGLDQFAGYSFTRSAMGVGDTNVRFEWVVPGRQMRMTTRSEGYSASSTDLRMNPKTGVPDNYTITPEGWLTNEAPADEDSIRSVYRITGSDRFQEMLQKYRNGRWRAWTTLGIPTNFNYRSDQAIEASRQSRAAFMGAATNAMNNVNNQLQAEQAERDRQTYLQQNAMMHAREAQAQRERAALEAQQAQAQTAQRRTAEAQSQARAQTRTQAASRQSDEQQQKAAPQPAADRRMAEQAAAQKRAEQQRAKEEQAAEARRAAAQQERDRLAEQSRQEAAAREAERTRLVDFPEAVVLCELTGPQAQFGNWRCVGPLQTTIAKLDTAKAAVPLDQACGGGKPRELGVTGSYRAFGCGFGVRKGHLTLDDIPTRLGVSFVPGRGMFRCPANTAERGCRSR